MIRLQAVSQEESVKEPFLRYFQETGEKLQFANRVFEVSNPDLNQLKEWNKEWYQAVQIEFYDESYANPAYAVSMLGKEFGSILSFLYAEIMACFIHGVEKNIFQLTITNELFLEIYQGFVKNASKKAIQRIIYEHMRDYSGEIYEARIREQLVATHSSAVDIVMQSDFSNSDCLYQYGEYISENEIKTLEFLQTMSKGELRKIANTYVEGFHEGFIINNIDMSKKETVNIRYTIGFEPIIREAVHLFEEIGLSPILYRSGITSWTKGLNRIGYIATSPNPQFEYDHRYDMGLYFDKGFMQHKLECYYNAYEKLKMEAYVLAGPACMETFGEHPFVPVQKAESIKLSAEQQKLSVEFQKKASEIINEYIKPSERSFTIIAYPIPEIGENFPAIFGEIAKVNTLDKNLYRKIQQKLIDALDQGVEVHVKGEGNNRTDLYVGLQPLKNPENETNFENCLADVNIPVGEVFTSPKLAGTNGILHVSEVYLRDLKFIDLELEFKNGKIARYSCKNFESEEENQAFLKENLLYHQETLPMGEFAIGTNTTAYAVANKYDILYKLPILIVEKMGPHFAVGDTCYSHSESVEVHNPDGKEIVAKNNDCSLAGEYFNCHTDITIPYRELDSIDVIKLGGEEIPLIKKGKFVLPGCEILNEPLTEE
ncbi:MAG: aminopeptidase [Anaerostipes sp.]|nr:aminopeptidase [Anaerostipes sp.]